MIQAKTQSPACSKKIDKEGCPSTRVVPPVRCRARGPTGRQEGCWRAEVGRKSSSKCTIIMIIIIIINNTTNAGEKGGEA